MHFSNGERVSEYDIYGQVISVSRKIPEYEHFGIYIGYGKVIDFSSDSIFKENSIRERTLENFLEESQFFYFYDFNIESNEFSEKDTSTPEETVNKAKSKLGDKGYNLLTNNCEHFAIWCKTGVHQSRQIDKFLGCVKDSVIKRRIYITNNNSEKLKKVKKPNYRIKPYVNICTLGHAGHGKSTLTAAITKVLAKYNQAKETPYLDISKGAIYEDRGIPINTYLVEYETNKRIYMHTDCPRHEDYVKGLIIGAVKGEGAILVVSATDGPMTQTREHLFLASQIGISKLVVFLNKVDIVEDEVLIELIEMEIRELLSTYGFLGDDVPIVIGSALKALQGDPFYEEKIWELMDYMDYYIPKIESQVNKSFLMTIEEVFSIINRGVVVVGHVECGKAEIGDRVDIIGLKNEHKNCTLAGFEMFHKLLTYISAGDNVGAFLCKKI